MTPKIEHLSYVDANTSGAVCNRSTGQQWGSEPHWADLLTGRAIERSNDESLLGQAEQILARADADPAAVLTVTGTAGTGKSTALMRLGLRLTDRGFPVLWVDKESEASPALIRQVIWEATGPLAVILDDADLYGHSLSGMIADIVPNRPALLIAIGVRSGKIDPIVHYLSRTGSVHVVEHVIPHLTDDDIDGLIDTLDRANRLGILKGKPRHEQRKAFARQAGRQLLVAMIQATSGDDFETKVVNELDELQEMQRVVYALICVASNFRHYLTRDEILIALGGDERDAVLFALDRLVARHLVRAAPPKSHYQSRHRLIASIVFDRLQAEGKLNELIEGLAFAAATKAHPSDNRNSRAWRMLKVLINHDLLQRILPSEQVRRLYESLETVLNADYHYWLQRGSFEVERGDLRLAQNFLDQSRSLSPDDYRVETEYGYLLLRRAQAHDAADRSRDLFEEGAGLLEEVVRSHGNLTPYPFHILATQGSAWVLEAQLSPSERRRILDRLFFVVDSGAALHPLSTELQQAKKDLQRERLMTVVEKTDHPT